MQAGIHDQSVGPDGFVIEVAIALPWIVIQAELIAERLRIQRPAFAERGRLIESAERGQIIDLLRNRALKMMPGGGFMQRCRDCRKAGTLRRQVSVDPEYAGARAVGRRRVVVSIGLDSAP